MSYLGFSQFGPIFTFELRYVFQTHEARRGVALGFALARSEELDFFLNLNFPPIALTLLLLSSVIAKDSKIATLDREKEPNLHRRKPSRRILVSFLL